MANRFWVLSGGTGTWDSTATGKWSTTSGGSPGAAVPTASDDVFFDSNSGTGTITLGATGNCRSLTTTGYNGTFTGSDDLNIGTSTAGSLTIGSGTTWSYSGTLSFVGTSTNTVTTNGKTISILEVSGTGNSVTLNDNLTADNLLIFAGTFSANGKTLNIGVVAVEGIDSRNRTLDLGSSLANFSTFLIDQSAGGTSTITPGTSQITMDSDGASLASSDGTAFTLNRLVLASTTNSSGGVSVISQVGVLAVTVNDYLGLTGYVNMGTAEGLTAIHLTGNLHLGGTPSLVINSDDASQVAFNVSGTITTGNSTLTDINATGSSTAWNFAASAATIIDGGNNTGITFPIGGSSGTAIGIATVSGVGKGIHFTAGSSTGSATATGIGKGAHLSIGTSTGSASVLGIGKEVIPSVGIANGTSSVLGIGKAIFKAIGAAQGVATVLGFSPVKMLATGVAHGTCIVQAQGNLIPRPPSPQPTEDALNIATPTETALNIANPREYPQNIQNPIEYAA